MEERTLGDVDDDGDGVDDGVDVDALVDDRDIFDVFRCWLVVLLGLTTGVLHEQW